MEMNEGRGNTSEHDRSSPPLSTTNHGPTLYDQKKAALCEDPGHSDVVMSTTLPGSNKVTSGHQLYVYCVCTDSEGRWVLQGFTGGTGH